MKLNNSERISRRVFLKEGSLAVPTVAGLLGQGVSWGAENASAVPLQEFDYSDVLISSDLHEAQLRNTHAVLMSLSEDSLLKPFRQMSGMPAPGEDLDGWYRYDPDYDYRKNFDDGFAPGCPFGQWVSALARAYRITGDEATRQKVLRLNRLYSKTITGDFYAKNRFPAYTYDKLLLGLLDAHTYAKDRDALTILEQTTDTALQHLPPHAVEHDVRWRMDKDPQDLSWTWDESYTMPENLFIAYKRGAGRRYYDLGLRYLDDASWFDPLSRDQNVFAGRHAYSYVNSLSSAMMAYLVAGSERHLRAARNAFRMLEEQSFATGGWGPDEQLRAPGTNDLYDSLTNTHHSFETPCGAYAHFKLTRYLLRVTRDARYGDSMERMMYNTVLGAKPLQDNGEAFYYSDYNFDGKRVYKEAHWPCCAGTLPQVAADYRINAYFRGLRAVFVNLYIPSTLRWIEDRSPISLTQEGDYPFEDHVTFTIKAHAPTELTVHFRIPAWAEGASLLLNGRRQEGLAIAGRFAGIRREWKSGDRVELELPMKPRLEAIDSSHPDTVALMWGPLVLMAVKQDQNSPLPKVTREQLLGVQRVSARRWLANSNSGKLKMLAFTSIGDLPYSTYLKLG